MAAISQSWCFDSSYKMHVKVTCILRIVAFLAFLNLCTCLVLCTFPWILSYCACTFVSLSCCYFQFFHLLSAASLFTNMSCELGPLWTHVNPFDFLNRDAILYQSTLCECGRCGHLLREWFFAICIAWGIATQTGDRALPVKSAGSDEDP